MIEARNLSRSFGGVCAVDALSFNTRNGEILGIVGPDGAGKSTLLRMMAAILKPDSGEILLDGTVYDIRSLDIKKRIAYMPGRFGLYEDLTVEENIFFFGRLFGMRKTDIRQRLPLLYSFSRLEPFKNRLAGKLSGGMKQKLGLACCLVHSPDVILLDEPTNGVDPVSRREFWRILYEILEDGVTVIVSTAYLDEAERCGRVALMYNGRFIITGDPESIKKAAGMPMLEIITADPVAAETVLRKTGRFSRVIRTGNALRLFSKDTRKTSSSIRAILKPAGIYVRSIKESAPGLEDVFVEIISRGGNIT